MPKKQKKKKSIRAAGLWGMAKGAPAFERDHTDRNFN